ncbi:MAG: hypothetical protein EXS08_16500 [Planctomycetes bacterium]|nr:hypothetical protein [Planctomycetota bacterium]
MSPLTTILLVLPLVACSRGASSAPASSSLRRLEFQVVDPSGKPAQGVLIDVFYPDRAANERAAGVAFPQDHVVLELEKERADLCLRTRDCRVTWVRDAHELTTVEMKPLLSVRLRLARPIALERERELLLPLVRLEGVGIAQSPVHRAEAFDERGEYVVQIGEPGRYSVSYQITVRKARGLEPSRELNLERLQTIDVLDVDPEQVFVVEVPERAVQEALENLR